MLHSTASRQIPLATAVVFGVALAALLVIALFPIFPRQLNIRVDDIAARTVRSPQTVSFVSDFLTEQRRDEAAAAVPPSLVYDPDVRAQQLEAFAVSAASSRMAAGSNSDCK